MRGRGETDPDFDLAGFLTIYARSRPSASKILGIFARLDRATANRNICAICRAYGLSAALARASAARRLDVWYRMHSRPPPSCPEIRPDPARERRMPRNRPDGGRARPAFVFFTFWPGGGNRLFRTCV